MPKLEANSLTYPSIASASRSTARGGGALLTEARCGWVDEKGASSPIVPGGGLDQVFGCRELELTPLAKTGVVEIKAADEAFPLLKPGDKLDSLFFEESLDVFGKTSRVVAAFPDGRPAIVTAPFGKGRAIIVGSFLGSAYHHFKNPNNGKLFAGLADWLKITAPVDLHVSEEGKNFGNTSSGPVMVPAGRHHFDLVNQSVAVRMRSKSSTDRLESSTRMGRRPCSSGMRSDQGTTIFCQSVESSGKQYP